MHRTRAGEPEPVFFGCSEPEPAEEKTGAGAEAAKKKPGAGAAKIRRPRLRLLIANN